VLDLAKAIAELLDVPIDPVHEEPRAGDVRDSQADNTAARAKLGWEPTVGFEEGLRRTIDWFTAS
jgi:UDP-glucose 4-epimerase